MPIIYCLYLSTLPDEEYDTSPNAPVRAPSIKPASYPGSYQEPVYVEPSWSNLTPAGDLKTGQATLPDYVNILSPGDPPLASNTTEPCLQANGTGSKVKAVAALKAVAVNPMNPFLPAKTTPTPTPAPDYINLREPVAPTPKPPSSVPGHVVRPGGVDSPKLVKKSAAPSSELGIYSHRDEENPYQFIGEENPYALPVAVGTTVTLLDTYGWARGYDILLDKTDTSPSWLHYSSLSRPLSEQILARFGRKDGAFLVRRRTTVHETDIGFYALSLVIKGCFQHHLIDLIKGGSYCMAESADLPQIRGHNLGHFIQTLSGFRLISHAVCIPTISSEEEGDIPEWYHPMCSKEGAVVQLESCVDGCFLVFFFFLFFSHFFFLFFFFLVFLGVFFLGGFF